MLEFAILKENPRIQIFRRSLKQIGERAKLRDKFKNLIMYKQFSLYTIKVLLFTFIIYS